MHIEQDNNLYLSLKEEISKLKDDLNKTVTSVKAQEVLDFCNYVNKEVQSKMLLASNAETLTLLLEAEELAYRVLPLFTENLPSVGEIENLVNATGAKRHKLLAQIREKYPYAIRSVHNPHLYLPLLKRMNKVYGESSHPVEKDMRHETGHFSRQLAQKNAPNFTPQNEMNTEFLAIIHREGNGLAFQPAIIQDESALTPAERLAVTNETGDLSIGDKAELNQPQTFKILDSLRQTARKHLIKSRK